ncbi:unnamed protein product [Lactuca virosa]|uniref:Transposase MuDR plant domain-containing protein n=1 Tax=Lactuca virosa TaxID=75947 RepID=A0AAU9N0H4_9ASTR|nr:unnamed protein product [Lactuca virosa]
METVEDFETIDVELDELFIKKQTPRFKDEFLNTFCEEGLEDCSIPDVQIDESDGDESLDLDHEDETDDKEGASQKGLIEKEDEDDVDFQYSIHDQKVKWNKIRPVFGERYKSPQQLKLCLTNYSIKQVYRIRFEKCDSVRLVVVCTNE